jgi:hypothetical protein
MNNIDSERLDYLSDKNIADTITPDELKELTVLLNEWNSSVESGQFKIPSK